ncbi:hypothetical protein EK21DRAFT_88485 [Setomelanomma holmii]|uniref:Uncharacterized protein n=1 Tax=Setomelanomma holmii TaxID=210430 RepID=A0A9P4LN81_9PLEO|nr:hypothetical protein EK21DRAFT_88485 [Setomelanomma holmii]
MARLLRSRVLVERLYVEASVAGQGRGEFGCPWSVDTVDRRSRTTSIVLPPQLPGSSRARNNTSRILSRSEATWARCSFNKHQSSHDTRSVHSRETRERDGGIADKERLCGSLMPSKVLSPSASKNSRHAMRLVCRCRELEVFFEAGMRIIRIPQTDEGKMLKAGMPDMTTPASEVSSDSHPALMRSVQARCISGVAHVVVSQLT